MKERPILFMPENVVAILADRKVQTRRTMKGQPYTLRTEGWGFPTRAGGFVSQKMIVDDCPYGVVGDKLWVREPWCSIAACDGDPEIICYKADDSIRIVEVKETSDGFEEYVGPEIEGSANVYRDEVNDPWKSSMFMPRYASRITLELTDVRVERVQDISEDDALAEGITGDNVIVGANCNGGFHVEETDMRYFVEGIDDQFESPCDAYEKLWDKINAKRNGGIYQWSRNPWVWALSFRRVE